jgi:hypothetical protein
MDAPQILPFAPSSNEIDNFSRWWEKLSSDRFDVEPQVGQVILVSGLAICDLAQQRITLS